MLAYTFKYLPFLIYYFSIEKSGLALNHAFLLLYSECINCFFRHTTRNWLALIAFICKHALLQLLSYTFTIRLRYNMSSMRISNVLLSLLLYFSLSPNFQQHVALP